MGWHGVRPDGAQRDGARARHWLGAAVSAGGLVGLGAVVAPAVTVRAGPAYALAVVSVVALVLGVAVHAPSSGRSPLWTGGLAAVALAALALRPISGVAGSVLVTTFLLLSGTALGSAIGARVIHPGHLLLVAWVSTLADLWSVYHPAGPSRAVVCSPHALSVLALPFPLLGTDRVEPLLGAGDVVFAALYLAAARTHNLSQRRTLAALGVGFAVAFLVVWGTGTATPVLPFLGAAFLLAQPAARYLPPPERRLGAIVAGLLTFVVLVSMAR